MKSGLKSRDRQYIVNAIKQFPEIEQATLFGSRALASHKKGSDVDLAVSGKQISHNTVAHLRAMLNEDLPLPYFFDVVCYERIANENLKRHIDEKGIVIFDSKKN
ncbi:nucleotidyltransferase domain-containing protein [candidate division KSB1 bacterium]|nr:nucleotidyltransferase domain-containing protein [candidate division KSB1 bacterium]